MQAPWSAPIRTLIEATDPRGAGTLDLHALNRLARQAQLATAAGLPLRFIDARQAPAAPYEQTIRDTGQVPTRLQPPGMLHDWFNALAWLAFPCLKGRLNEMQAAAIDAAGIGERRGALRDAITVFDESGVLFVCDDAQLIDALRSFDWQRLFVAQRARFADAVVVHVVGHALHEKLLAPYKALCGHAWVVPADPRTPLAELDRGVAQMLTPQTLQRRAFTPLPLLGVPGWWSANEDPLFYNDPAVFRSGRANTANKASATNAAHAAPR